jgi:hypothetical protein
MKPVKCCAPNSSVRFLAYLLFHLECNRVAVVSKHSDCEILNRLLAAIAEKSYEVARSRKG